MDSAESEVLAEYEAQLKDDGVEMTDDMQDTVGPVTQAETVLTAYPEQDAHAESGIENTQSTTGSSTNIRSEFDTYDAQSVRGSFVDVRPGTAAPRGSLSDVGDLSGLARATTSSRRASATSLTPRDPQAGVSMESGDAGGDDSSESVPARARSRLASSTSRPEEPPVKEVNRPGTAATAPPPRPPSTRPPASRPGSETPAARAARASATRTRTPLSTSVVNDSAPVTSAGPKSRWSESLDQEPLVEETEEELEFQGVNIWEFAERMNRARMLRGLQSVETHGSDRAILFVGGRQAGKSSMIHKLLDREEIPKPTLGLEYSYGRKAGRSVAKDVCHIWELGGGTAYTALLKTPLHAPRLPHVAIFIVVDLTRPELLWDTLDTMLKALREVVESEVAGSQGRELQLKERLRAAAELRVPSDHQDAAQMRVFPVPLVIIGGRYDAFQDWEPERRKLVCRTLRYLAHVNGATLQFFSARDAALVKKAKDLMTYHAFGGETSGGQLAQDYNKPILVPAGADSLPVIMGVGADTSLAAVRNAFIAQYPQDETGSGALPEDPARDINFREPEIDQLRSQKDQELERLRREVERRQKWGEELL